MNSTFCSTNHMCSLESVDGWLQWIHNCLCVLEDTWASDLQLRLSVYLLAGVVVIWFLIGIAWWIYGEAISSLFELRSMNFKLEQCMHSYHSPVWPDYIYVDHLLGPFIIIIIIIIII